MTAPQDGGAGHRVLIARAPDGTLPGIKTVWLTSCTHNHFLRFSATWDGALSWATKHCPAINGKRGGAR